MNVDPSKGIGRALFSALTPVGADVKPPGTGIGQADPVGFLRNGLPGWKVGRVCAGPGSRGHSHRPGTFRSTWSGHDKPFAEGSGDTPTDSYRQCGCGVWHAATLCLLSEVLRPGCALDLRRPEQGAALLHHERQGPDSSSGWTPLWFSGRHGRQGGMASSRPSRAKRWTARINPLPGSSLLVSQPKRHMGRRELVGQRCNNRAASRIHRKG